MACEFGQSCNNYDYGFVITMQHAVDVNESRVLMAAMPAEGVISATLNARTLANNVQFDHDQKRVFTALSTDSREERANGRESQTHSGNESPAAKTDKQNCGRKRKGSED